jgi:hypothetical protein
MFFERGGWQNTAWCDLMESAASHPPGPGHPHWPTGRDSTPRGLDLRAGAITASAGIGRSDSEIMAMSGHRNQAVMRSYIRGQVFGGRNPLEGVL